MGKLRLKVMALFLVLCLLLSGCGLFSQLLEEQFGPSVSDLPTLNETSLAELEYTRPQQADLQAPLDQCKALAAEGKDLDKLIDSIYVFYDAYDLFLTNCAVADLRYYTDVTNSYWTEESTYCTNNTYLADAALEELFYALAKSPLLKQLESEEYFGEGYFDAYQGEATGMDPQLLALYEQEAAYLNEYYELAEQFDGNYLSSAYETRWMPQFAQLYAKLIGVRQQIASFWGFGSYAEYAYAVTYSRDYTPDQAVAFMKDLQKALYDQYYYFDIDTISTGYSTESQTYGYVESAAKAMGGDVLEGFRYLTDNKLYDISYGPNKYDISYEIFLWSYQVPVLFMKPYQDQTDLLTFAHEFGHYLNDYVCAGSYAGIDVAEIHSQAFEYLSLLYADAPEDLTRFKLYDSLCTYMETSAYSLFEHQAYQLSGNDLTGENLIALAEEIATDFGFDAWGSNGNDFVTIGHFYTHPMYMISYVVSNDVAMQFYQLELDESGQGLALYEECIYSQDSQIMSFARQYGLESPFVPGRAATIAQTFKEALQ